MQIAAYLPGWGTFKRMLVTITLLGASGYPSNTLWAFQHTDQSAPGTQGRQALDAITTDEEAAADRIARAEPKVKELLGERGIRLVSATPVLIKQGEPPDKIDLHQRAIEVILFRPEGEIGVRVIVHLHQNRAAEVQRLTAAQVPFTNDDLNDAFQLALRDAEVQRELGPAAQTFHVPELHNNTASAAASENIVTGLPIRTTDPKDACSKHRCLQLFFRRGTDFLSRPVVTVDLTEKHVTVDRSESR